MREEIPMGKVLSTVWVTKEEDLSQLKSGPYSIITWRNLGPSSEAESKKPKAKERPKERPKEQE